MVDRTKIGDFLRELRNEKNLTQEELAEKYGVSSRSVSRWENGITMPELGLLVELAKFYEVDIKEIIDGERKSEIMEKETDETLSKVADYANAEKIIAIKRKSLVTFITTIAIIGVVIAIICFLKEVPIIQVSSEETSVEAIYRYEAGGENKFFILCKMPCYSGQTSTTYSVRDRSTLVITTKRPILAKNIPELSNDKHIIICRSGYVSKDDNGSEWKEYESVKFGGKEVWNINNDADVQIPEYVIAYDMFEKTDNELVSWTIEDDYMQAEYWDGSYIKWDYEGNVLSDNTH